MSPAQCAAEMEANLAAVDRAVNEQMAARGPAQPNWTALLCSSAWRVARELRVLRRRLRPSSPGHSEIRARAQRFFDTRLPVVERHLGTMTAEERHRVRYCLSAVAAGAGGSFPAFAAMRRRLM